MKCACCDHVGEFRACLTREMMFGRRDAFTYDECPACGSLQIREVPANLADYYPADYFAFDTLPAFLREPPSLRRRLTRALVTTLPGLTPWTRRRAERYPFFHWARLARIGANDAVLDVGCGAGLLLWRMRRCGYRNLTGVDPYLNTESSLPGLVLRRAEIAAVPGEFDLIMMHHVLEHLPDPAAALRAARGRLRPGGRILARFPLAGSPLAKEYGADWFNLDPPRHLVIPSRAGFLRLAAGAGLKICHEETDSTPLSVLYSECYRRNVAMKEAPEGGTAAERRQARARITQLNARGEGDCGLFLLVATG